MSSYSQITANDSEQLRLAVDGRIGATRRDFAYGKKLTWNLLTRNELLWSGTLSKNGWNEKSRRNLQNGTSTSKKKSVRNSLCRARSHDRDFCCELIPNLATYVRTDVLVASRSLILLTHSLSTQPTYRTNSVTPTCPTRDVLVSQLQCPRHLTTLQSPVLGSPTLRARQKLPLHSPATSIPRQKFAQVQCWPGTLDFHIKKI